jgi:hypothetical protein
LRSSVVERRRIEQPKPDVIGVLDGLRRRSAFGGALREVPAPPSA